MAESVNTVRAAARGVHMAPRKLSLVASLVRGRTVADALVILSHTPKRAALPVSKLIASAKANATNNHSLNGDTLRIASLQVTAGSRLKRYRAGARGQAKPYQKKTSHIVVEVVGDVKVKRAAAAAKADKSATTKVAEPKISKSSTKSEEK